MPIEHFDATAFFTRVKLLVELGAIPGVKTKKVIDLYNDMSRASIRAIPLPPQTTQDNPKHGEHRRGEGSLGGPPSTFDVRWM